MYNIILHLNIFPCDIIKNKPSNTSNSLSVVVCFLLSNSPASEFYMPTFRNALFVPSS